MISPRGMSILSKDRTSPSSTQSVPPEGSAPAAASAEPAVQSKPTTPGQVGQESRSKVAQPKAACTHLVMDRVYGDFACQVCHKTPRLGFVYFCQQDLLRSPAALRSQGEVSRTHHQSFLGASEQASTMSKQLADLSFNHTVVEAAAMGHYSKEQVLLMIDQKMNVERMIQQAISERKFFLKKIGLLGTPAAIITNDRLGLVGPNQSIYEHPGQSSSKPGRDPQETAPSPPEKGALGKNQKSSGSPASLPKKSPLAKAFQSGEFRVCHACRPHVRDRCYTSFEAAYNGEVRPLNAWIPQLMPVAPASIVKTLGLKKPLRQPPGVSGPFTLESEDSDESGQEGVETTPSPRFSEASRSSASEDLKSLLHIQKHISTEDFKDAKDTSRMFTASTAPLPATTAAPKNIPDETYAAARAHLSIKPQPSSTGFRATLAKDMRAIIERAHREVQTSPLHCDALTCLDGDIVNRLMARYNTHAASGPDREIFDLTLWKALSEAILDRAAFTPLPGRDGDGCLDLESSVDNDEAGPVERQFRSDAGAYDGAVGRARGPRGKARMQARAPIVRGLGIMVEGHEGEGQDGLMLELKMGGSTSGDGTSTIHATSEDNDDGVLGVALTEEAAEVGSPDVILSAVGDQSGRDA